MKTFSQFNEGRSVPTKQRHAEFESLIHKQVEKMQKVLSKGPERKITVKFTHGKEKSRAQLEVTNGVLLQHEAKAIMKHHDAMQQDIAGFNLKHKGAKLHDKEFGKD
jgi:hypothetical protein